MALVAAHFHGFGVALSRLWNTVEKVVVGAVGSPKHPRTQAKTLQNRRLKPLNRGQISARGSFSTGWLLPGTWLNKGKKEAVKGIALPEAVRGREGPGRDPNVDLQYHCMKAISQKPAQK